MKKRVLGAAVAVAGVAALAVVAKKFMKKVPNASEPIFQETTEFAERAEQVAPDYYAAVRNAYDGGPNANPINATAVETPRTPDGKIDVMKLVSPEDFCNWDELGCQS